MRVSAFNIQRVVRSTDFLTLTELPLVDVNTENDSVISYLNDYIKTFVAEYNIDGLRIDGTSPSRPI